MLLASPAGEQIQVGSACMQDYLGITAVPTMFFDAEADIDQFIGGLDKGETLYTPETVLAAACAIVKEHGYVRASEPGSTVSLVWTVLSPANRFEAEIAREYAPLVQDARVEARELREWLLSEEFSGDSEYVRNLKNIAAGEMVTPRRVGLLASAPQAYAKAQERSLIREREAASIRNEHYGEVGEKVTVRVKVQAINYSENQWGVSTIYTLLSEDGYVFKWFAKDSVLGDKKTEEWFTVRGKIKKHDEWNGTKQTQIYYCTRVD